MSSKTVAIAGAGGFVGKTFTEALLDNAFKVRILTRESSIDSAPLQDFKKRGASLHAISYEDEASIIKALEGVDTVIATVAGTALVSAQVPLIKAAKKAGVKLYFPSEYGSEFEDDSNPSPVIQAKKTVLKTAKEVGLPVAAVSNGGFPEYCFIPPIGYAFAEKKVTIWGDGNAKNSWTTVRDVAQWVANVLKTVPIEQLQDKHFRIQGDLASSNEIVKLWEKKHNDKLQVEYRPVEEVENRIQADKNDFLAILIKEWSSGRGQLNAPLSNDLYPGWKPSPVESVL
ncbi:hypothetical protein FRC12_009288 [Ceratobasidium sp. 428]|nr:hypothetical protein FRC09_008436 [Ceratobasidium sp. 395]KAG8761889.1 hypothetical protein FRC12_009288 [Ceratobasidium sp. 428]